jgi:hypothetical protein
LLIGDHAISSRQFQKLKLFYPIEEEIPKVIVPAMFLKFSQVLFVHDVLYSHVTEFISKPWI